MQKALTLEQVLDKEPDLGFSGFKEPFFTPEGDREDMLTERAHHQFERAVQWLIRQPRTKNVNPRAGTSYRLKHIAEADMNGYISNGMFIAAAIALGFEYERNEKTEIGGKNVWINIGLKMTRVATDRLLVIVDGT